MEDADLEALPRKDFMALIMKNMGTVLDEKLKPVSTKIDETTDSSMKEKLQMQVTQFAKDHKDFDDWKEEMGAKIKSTPGLSLEDAYALVRVANPEKAKELDDKFAEAANEERKNNEEKDKKPTFFGGMEPSTGDRSEQRKDMNQDDAANAAWDEVMGESTSNVDQLLNTGT